MNRQTKLISWHVLVAFLAWKLWEYGKYASFNSFTGVDLEPASVLNFLLLISVIVLGYILFQQRRWAWTIGGIVGILFLAMLGWTLLNLVAVGALLLFNLWSATRVRREIHERRILNIVDAFYHGLLPVVLGLFIMISFAAYQSPFAEEVKKTDRLPSQAETIVRSIVEKTIGNKVEGTTPQQKQRAIDQVASQTFQEFNRLLRPYFQYAPPVLAFGLFLILWGLSFLFVWAGMVIGMALYWILKRFKVVRIETRQVDAEVLVV